jgi:nucleoside-diphosphate kinase
MMIEKTFAIIKPHAVEAKDSGEVISLIEEKGFDILRMQKIQLTKAQAEQFYAIHKEKPFFGALVKYVTAGPAIIMVLQKDNAIKAWRDFMGATDPEKSEPGTLRNLFGESIDFNVVHGSDAPETAKLEIGQFFPDLV